jgi:hypothetical protein
VAIVAHAFPSLTQQLGVEAFNLTTDTLQVALIGSGTITWNTTTQGYTTLPALISGAGLTEVSTSGTGYARQTLTGVSYTTSGLVNALTCSSPTWSSAAFSALYAVFFDASVSNGLLCMWDFGGSASATPFVLGINSGGLIQWQSS